MHRPSNETQELARPVSDRCIYVSPRNGPDLIEEHRYLVIGSVLLPHPDAPSGLCTRCALDAPRAPEDCSEALDLLGCGDPQPLAGKQATRFRFEVTA